MNNFADLLQASAYVLGIIVVWTLIAMVWLLGAMAAINHRRAEQSRNEEHERHTRLASAATSLLDGIRRHTAEATKRSTRIGDN